LGSLIPPPLTIFSVISILSSSVISLSATSFTLSLSQEVLSVTSFETEKEEQKKEKG